MKYLSRGFVCQRQGCGKIASKEIENQRNGDVVGHFCDYDSELMLQLLQCLDEMAAWRKLNESRTVYQTPEVEW